MTSVKYDKSSKQFLSKLPYEFSTIAWHVTLQERGETDVQVRSEIRLTDCSKSIVIDMNLCLADPQQYTTKEAAKEMTNTRLDKLDCLIDQLTLYRREYLIALSLAGMADE
jgi:hypothetical protein